MTYRKQIRDRVRDLLVDRTAAGNQVLSGRTFPANPKPEPILCVYVGPCLRTGDDLGDRFSVELDIVIEGIVGVRTSESPSSSNDEVQEDVESLLETLEDEIRSAIDCDHTLGNAVIDTSFHSSSLDVINKGPVSGAVGVIYKAKFHLDRKHYEKRIPAFPVSPMPAELRGIGIGGPRPRKGCT